MKYDHTKLNLPFHPGDPLFRVSEETGYKVEKTNDKIIGVLITEDSIRIIRKMPDAKSEIDFITVEPNEEPNYFLSEKDAEEYASIMKIKALVDAEKEEKRGKER